MKRDFNGVWQDDYLNQVAFPLGGMGAGMICLEGTGALSHVSLRHEPEVFNEPYIFSALTIKTQNGDVTKVLEGPVPKRKIFGAPMTANGGGATTYGLPRFSSSEFSANFPFATVDFESEKIPLKASICAWSPFIPLDSDNSSLPCSALEFSFENPTNEAIEAVYSFSAANFMKINDSKGEAKVEKIQNGFVLAQSPSKEQPWDEGYFCAMTDDPSVKINPAWFRGGWSDSRTMNWKDIAKGACADNDEIGESEQSGGGTLSVPFKAKAKSRKTIRIMLCWHVPESNLRVGREPGEESCCCDKEKDLPKYKPWYSTKFKGINETVKYWRENYDKLREQSLHFSQCLSSSNLPKEAMEAICANLTILKSPTVLRQADGRLWCWEGCCDSRGCCHGTCTHVWNYAQALPHLFPDLERGLRQTEFNENQDKRGHQTFRASLPIRPTSHKTHAAADGQLGGIMKIYREWRICDDIEWLKEIWPKVIKSLDYCIETWDPEQNGVLLEPHHNTYDIEFWGADGMCSSFYLGALKATGLMGNTLGYEVKLYDKLYQKGKKYLEEKLFNGEYFIQNIQWENLRAPSPAEFKGLCENTKNYSPEALELLKKEGPKYQYGSGCLSDGIVGAWLAEMCGLGAILDKEKIKSHLLSVYKYNLKLDLSDHVNPQRPTYAIGKEGGLLTCSWPKGGRLSIPFPYSEEVFTGIEYQVASHLTLMGCGKEALDIVRTARERYDGRVRNPFNEYECGHWYARAMSSYGLIQGLTGIRYDAIEKTLYIKPTIKGDFKAFVCAATGYGLAGIKDGKPFVDVRSGKIEIEKVDY